MVSGNSWGWLVDWQENLQAGSWFAGCWGYRMLDLLEVEVLKVEVLEVELLEVELLEVEVLEVTVAGGGSAGSGGYWKLGNEKCQMGDFGKKGLFPVSFSMKG